MLRTTARILLSALAVSAQPVFEVHAAESKGCKLTRQASVDLKLMGSEILIPVMIENKPALMLLNTSSAATVIWLPAAQAFGLTPRTLPGNAQIHFGQQRITHYVSTRSFALGRMHFAAEQLLLARAPEPSLQTSDAGPIVGAIGMDFFANIDFELDFKNRHLHVYSQDHCPGKAVYWTDTYASAPLRRAPLGNFYFPMELDGKKLRPRWPPATRSPA
jgi:hypothetical protein